MTTIEIPSSIDKIFPFAFKDNPNLTKITINKLEEDVTVLAGSWQPDGVEVIFK